MLKELPKFQTESDGPMDSMDNDGDLDNGSAVLVGNETDERKEDAVKIVKKGDVKVLSGFYTPNRRKRPFGRKSEKEDKMKDENTQRKLELAISSLALQPEQVEKMKKRNEKLAFSSNPGGAETPEAQEYFFILWKESPVAARQRLENFESAAKEPLPEDDLNVLGNSASDIVDLLK